MARWALLVAATAILGIELSRLAADPGARVGAGMMAAVFLLAAASVMARRPGVHTDPQRPWWVRRMIPPGPTRRASVVRAARATAALFAVWGGAALYAAYGPGGELSPYDVWVVAAALAWAIGTGVQFLAIRWMDRAGAWVRGTVDV